MTTADRVRAVRALSANASRQEKLDAYASAGPLPVAYVPDVADVFDSDHAAVLNDRNRLLAGYGALVRVVAAQLAGWRPHARYRAMRDAALDVPADVVDDIRWLLADELRANKQRASAQSVDMPEVRNEAA